jgi:hypothetical protein
MAMVLDLMLERVVKDKTFSGLPSSSFAADPDPGLFIGFKSKMIPKTSIDRPTMRLYLCSWQHS